MKKLFLVVLLIGIAAALLPSSLSAWEANDLTKYPSFTKDGDWILNLGIGFPGRYGFIPPVRLSFDRNTALGDQKLPFFFGGHVGYSGYGYLDKNKWFVHRIPVGFRFGYHFNWAVPNLDTYAVTTAGYVFHIGTGEYRGYYSEFGDFMIGVNIGARYFISKGFGFWLEAGYTSFSFLDIGLSFKF